MGFLCQFWILEHIHLTILANCVLCSSWLISSYWNNYVIQVAVTQHRVSWLWASVTAGWKGVWDFRSLEAMTQLVLDSAILSLDSLGTRFSLQCIRTCSSLWERGLTSPACFFLLLPSLRPKMRSPSFSPALTPASAPMLNPIILSVDTCEVSVIC